MYLPTVGTKPRHHRSFLLRFTASAVRENSEKNREETFMLVKTTEMVNGLSEVT